MPVAEEILKRLASLESQLSDWPERWEECSALVLPRFSRQGRVKDIFDSTAPLAVGRFAAALEGTLTPRTQYWHSLITGDPEIDANIEIKRYLERVRDILFRARYAPEANFANQLQEVYLALGVFGTAVLFIDDAVGLGLRYRYIPLNECLLAADAAGRIDSVFRRYKLTARQARQEFGEDLPPQISRDAEDPARQETEHAFLHAVFPRADFKPGRKDSKNLPIASYHFALDARAIVRESGYRVMPYAVARLSVAPGDVFGRSPAMDVLADIRLVNEMAKTILRSAQKAVAPPLLTADDDVLTGFNLRPGAINYGALDSQGRELVKPLGLRGDIGTGLTLIQESRKVINEAFYLNLFQILVDTPQKTATEVIERAQEKAQLLAPAMGRLQSELLRPIIERELDILSAAGALDNLDPPQALTVQPKYETPLAKALEANDGTAILQALQGVGGLASLDPSAAEVLNVSKAARTVAESLGVPARVLRSEEELAELEAQRRQAQAQAQAMQLGAAAVQGIEGLANAERALAQSQAEGAGQGLSPTALMELAR